MKFTTITDALPGGNPVEPRPLTYPWKGTASALGPIRPGQLVFLRGADRLMMTRLLRFMTTHVLFQRRLGTVLYVSCGPSATGIAEDVVCMYSGLVRADVRRGLGVNHHQGFALIGAHYLPGSREHPGTLVVAETSSLDETRDAVVAIDPAVLMVDAAATAGDFPWNMGDNLRRIADEFAIPIVASSATHHDPWRENLFAAANVVLVVEEIASDGKDRAAIRIKKEPIPGLCDVDYVVVDAGHGYLWREVSVVRRGMLAASTGVATGLTPRERPQRKTRGMGIVEGGGK